MLIIKSSVKDMVGDFQVSSDFVDALNLKVEQLVKDAVKRAESNGRKTVMGKDV